uniref:RNA polymerase alpha subunit n=1 Tax=Euglena clara TaxID=215708 RepID=A0A2Z4YV46_9EUGL|nr:RNA polymerase alpha subunit [Euglena clara]AXA45480.1 RNA polymerase alpha subunit [Euglena clara]
MENKKVLNKSLGLFKLNLSSQSKVNTFGNLIRQNLLKKVLSLKKNSFLYMSRLQVTDIALFISKNIFKVPSTYHVVNEFFELEEITGSLLDVYTNIRSVQFKLLQKNFNNEIFGILNCNSRQVFFAKDIVFNQKIEILNDNQLLLELLSSKLKLKIILKLQFWFCFFPRVLKLFYNFFYYIFI